ncbi:MAG: hypothetical protein RLZ98_2333 [Pseudomonadota bacterium]|jgi:hypothetical protein
MKLTRLLHAAIALVVLCGSAFATDSFKIRTVAGTFDSVFFELNNAIVDQGLVIDYTGHVHDMLTRTGDVTGSKSPYKQARYVQFCSAKLTHAAVQADPQNLAICPYVVFIYELAAKPGTVQVGYRRPIGSNSEASKTAMADIEKLLDQIVAAATK